jgi:phosphate transport system substrate-binding protein
MFRRLRVPTVAALAAAMVGAAGATAAASAPMQDASGQVVVSGSSTVEPITSLVGEKFAEENPDVAVRVDGPGTGDGFQLFCNGETDISDASRAIDEEEIAACQGNGINYTELKVGIDGLSVITSKDTKINCLTFNDLYALVGPQSEGFDNWQDAQPLATQLGSTTKLPRAKLEITAPGEESGTYDSFIEIALADPAEKQVEAGAITEDQAETTRKDYQSSGNDNTIIDGVAETKNSLGWVGFAFADQNKDKVKTLKVDNGDGKCVAPSAKTVRDGSYPIARDLYIYVNNAKAASNPALKSFVDFYMSKSGNTSVKESDYIQLAKADWNESVNTWKTAAQSLG